MDADVRLGFAHLNPQFGIRFGGNDKTRLPSACKLFRTFHSRAKLIISVVCQFAETVCWRSLP